MVALSSFMLYAGLRLSSQESISCKNTCSLFNSSGSCCSSLYCKWSSFSDVQAASSTGRLCNWLPFNARFVRLPALHVHLNCQVDGSTVTIVRLLNRQERIPVTYIALRMVTLRQSRTSYNTTLDIIQWAKILAWSSRQMGKQEQFECVREHNLCQDKNTS